MKFLASDLGVLYLLLEMRPDSPAEYGMQPQIPVAYGEEH